MTKKNRNKKSPAKYRPPGYKVGDVLRYRPLGRRKWVVVARMDLEEGEQIILRELHMKSETRINWVTPSAILWQSSIYSNVKCIKHKEPLYNVEALCKDRLVAASQ